MMVKPSVSEVMEARNIKSKYSLVIITAKRARDIVQSGQTFTECNSQKAVSIALNELYENKVSFRPNSHNAKPSASFLTVGDENVSGE